MKSPAQHPQSQTLQPACSWLVRSHPLVPRFQALGNTHPADLLGGSWSSTDSGFPYSWRPGVPEASCRNAPFYPLDPENPSPRCARWRETCAESLSLPEPGWASLLRRNRHFSGPHALLPNPTAHTDLPLPSCPRGSPAARVLWRRSVASGWSAGHTLTVRPPLASPEGALGH